MMSGRIFDISCKWYRINFFLGICSCCFYQAQLIIYLYFIFAIMIIIIKKNKNIEPLKFLVDRSTKQKENKIK